MEEDNEIKENPTTSIYVIGLKYDYKEDTKNVQHKKLIIVDLVWKHILKENNPAPTIILHGRDRQFYNFVKIGKQGLLP